MLPASSSARGGISTAEAEQLPRNRHAMVRNPTAAVKRASDCCSSATPDGGRALTLVIERTVDPTSWLIVTGWIATRARA